MVGIINTFPSEALDVDGNILASGSITGSSLNISGNLTVDTTTLKVDSVNNRIGINTASPTEALSITGNVVSSGSISAYGSIATTIGLQSAYLDVTNNAGVDTTLFVNSVTDKVGVNTLTPTEALSVVGNITSTGNISGATLSITGDAIFDTTTMKVDSTNNRVGIGNASPTDMLDVTGNIKTSGDIITTKTTARSVGSVGYIYNIGNNTALGTITANALNTFLVATMTISAVGVYIYTGKVHLGLSSAASNTITRLSADIRDNAGTTTYALVQNGPFTMVITNNQGISMEVSYVETVTSVPHIRKLYMVYYPSGTNLNSNAGNAYFNAVKIA